MIYQILATALFIALFAAVRASATFIVSAGHIASLTTIAACLATAGVLSALGRRNGAGTE